MRNIFIIHGSYGNPEENWFPWLKKELEKLGNRVFVPQFPIPVSETVGGHKLDEWFKKFEEYKQYLNKDTIIIAHSRGCIFTYHLFASLNKPIDSAYLVAPWINFVWYPKGYQGIDSFHKPPFQWNKIKAGAKYIEIFQSTNDDTPVEEGKEIAEKLGAKINIVKDAGHFNVRYSPTFKEFPQLLEQIKARL